MTQVFPYQRRREFLAADPESGIGRDVAIGIAGSLLLLRSLGTLLFGVTSYDVPTYAIVVVLLGAIAVLASYLPARRAACIEPLTALRQE